jgi:type VII secretion integral membrane protein EccD
VPKKRYRAADPTVKGPTLSALDPGLRRVSVHAGTAVVDVVLPAAVPVATLIPSIIDILDDCGAERSDDRLPAAYRLSVPGAPALQASTTLAQNDIRDGAVLILSRARAQLPAPRYDDVAEAVAATLDAHGRPWTTRPARMTGAIAAGFFTCIGGLTLIRNTLSDNTPRHIVATTGIAVAAGLIALLLAHRSARDSIAALTLSLIATAFAALAGFTAVPGASAAPNVLLAAMAAAVTSVLAIRITGRGVVALTAVSCFALSTAGAAFAAVIAAAPLRTIGSISALISLGLLGIAGRISIVLAGLSSHLPDDACLVNRAIRADAWLTSLLAAFSSSGAVGAIVTAAAARGDGAPRSGCIAFAAITGALLLLRARSAEAETMPVFVISGIITIGTTFAVCAAGAPGRGPWIATVMAMLVGAALYVAFVAPVMSPSPVLRRYVELSEHLAFLAMAPLTCWICGFYGAVRALNPT